MDTNLNINVDMGLVQSRVKASIRPAVEEALATYDLKAAILKQLTAPPPKEDPEGIRSIWARPYLMFRGYAEATDNIGSLLDQMVRECIEAIAKEYVETNLRMQRGEIEEAFRKMMNGSTNRLVKAFAGSVEDALKSDWGFKLKVEVEHKTKEQEADDD